MRFLMLLAVGVLVALASAPAAAQCKKKGKRPEVFVQGKTAVRRGPGLNYQVSTFLEKGKCLPFSQVSIDENWVLVDAGDQLGWVPLARLSSKSQTRVAKAKVAKPPIGSGQSRGYALVSKQSVMLERPDKNASPKRVLPSEMTVVPMATTEDGQWIQIRDDRGRVGWVPTNILKGDTLADLPINQGGFNEGTLGEPNESGPANQVVATRPGRSTEPSLGITAAAFGGALVPTHSLNTNAVSRYRRYDLTALSGAAGVELEFMDVGPTTIRANYAIAFLGGVTPDNFDQQQFGGFQHEAALRVGLPLQAGSALITPEVGYAFGMFDFESNFLTETNFQQTFISSVTNAGTVGSRFQIFMSRDLMLDIDAAAVVGVTSASPQSLGDGGFTLGAMASAGVQYFPSDLMGVTFRYMFNYRSTSFTGQAALDSEITEADLSVMTHGLMVGVSFLLLGS